MPPNRRALIVRRLRQADAALRRTCFYLAEVYHTIGDEHPLIAGYVMACIKQVDRMRQDHRELCLEHFTGSARNLWTAGDLDAIMKEAQELPDPWPRVSARRKRKYREAKNASSDSRRGRGKLRSVLPKFGRDEG